MMPPRTPRAAGVPTPRSRSQAHFLGSVSSAGGSQGASEPPCVPRLPRVRTNTHIRRLEAGIRIRRAGRLARRGGHQATARARPAPASLGSCAEPRPPQRLAACHARQRRPRVAQPVSPVRIIESAAFGGSRFLVLDSVQQCSHVLALRKCLLFEMCLILPRPKQLQHICATKRTFTSPGPWPLSP